MPSAEAGGKPVASDALVFFGATGDLAYKKIFPALQAMVRRGRLDGAGHRRRQVRLDASSSCATGPARASRSTAAGSTRRRSRSSSSLLRYVDGDYGDPATFAALRKALGKARAPDALPRHPAEHVRDGRRAARHSPAAPRARASSSRSPSAATSPRRRALNKTLHAVFPESAIFRIDHYLGKEPVAEPPVLPLRQRVPRADLEPQLRRQRADHDGRGVRRPGPRQVLRGDGRHPRRHPEPPAAGRRLPRHGAADRDLRARRSATSR